MDHASARKEIIHSFVCKQTGFVNQMFGNFENKSDSCFELSIVTRVELFSKMN